MRTVNAILVLTLALLEIGCGYSSKATTPPSAGNMPAITQLAPNSATAGGADFMLTVNGNHFNSDAKVNWGGAARTTTFVSASQVTAAISAADIAAAGTVPVTVTNPGHSGGTYGGGTLPETSQGMNFTIN